MSFVFNNIFPTCAAIPPLEMNAGDGDDTLDSAGVSPPHSSPAPRARMVDSSIQFRGT